MNTTKIKSFKDLVVWQRSTDLSVSIYSITQTFPKYEMFGLTSQMRRASISVSSNIAEGNGRRGFGEYLAFLKISFGSLSELESQLLVSYRLKYISEEVYNKIVDEITICSKMLYKLIKRLKDKQSSTKYPVPST